jgi:hypothetical protein
MIRKNMVTEVGVCVFLAVVCCGLPLEVAAQDCALEPGIRVESLFDNLRGAPDVMAGDLGTVICHEPRYGGVFWLVQWDNMTSGHDGLGLCGSTPDGTGMFVYVEHVGVLGCAGGDDDGDDDGVLDDEDNCPDVANADQADFDWDGAGDVCDDDDDGDSVWDDVDNCLWMANSDQTDLDGDGYGDACDDDDDGDGAWDDVDNCPDLSNADQADFDGDGFGDACDEDADDDGVWDDEDYCLFTPLDEVYDLSSGCSLTQLVPCEGPADADRSWKNHGEYVSGMSGIAREFARAGLITRQERAAIVSQAAKTDCGKKR